MTWYPAIELKELKQQGHYVSVLGGTKVLLLWHEDEVHAVQSQCPHFKLPLANGKINEKGELVCPFHKSAFDLKTGQVKCWAPWPAVVSSLLGKLSKPKDLKIYPSKIEKDHVFVEVV